MYRYLNNAFRVVGLTPEASIEEITQRVNEIKVKKSLDIELSYDFDFPWMGHVDRSQQNVINALQRLENPLSRLKEEIFWFWADTDTDRKALDCLVNGDRQAAHGLWKSVIDSKLPEQKKVSALVNQMVLSHSSVIGREITLKYTADEFTKKVCKTCGMQFGDDYSFCIQCGKKLEQVRVENAPEKKRNVNLSETHWKNWQFAISRISQLAENEYFWKKAKEKAKKINDPRLSLTKVQEVRDNFLSDIASPNFRFLSQSLVSKDYERTRQHAALLNGSSFSYEYLRKGFNEVLASHVTLIDRHCQTASKEAVDFEHSTNRSPQAVVNIYAKLDKSISDTITEGNLIDFNCISDFGLARDKLANNIKNIAIILNNLLVADKVIPPKKREWGYQKAHEMVKKAIGYAGSHYTKQKFAKDEELIKSNIEIERMNRSYYEREAPNTSKPSSTSYAPSGTASSKTNWQSFLGWAIMIGFIIFWIVMGLISSNDSTPSSTSSYNNQTSTPSVSLPQLRTRIENLATTINAKEARIKNIEASLKSKESDLRILQSEINDLDSRIKTVWFGKDGLIKKRNQKANQYNYLYSSYTTQYENYQSLFSSYKQDIATHDSLVQSYNSRIK